MSLCHTFYVVRSITKKPTRVDCLTFGKEHDSRNQANCVLIIVVSYVHLLYCLYVIHITVGAGYLSKVMVIHVDCRILIIMHSLIFSLPPHA